MDHPHALTPAARHRLHNQRVSDFDRHPRRYADRLVSHFYRERVLILRRVNRYRLQPKVPAGSQYPHRDLTAVGDQDGLHSACAAVIASGSSVNSGWPYSTD